MIWLLDSDTCSAHVKGHPAVNQKINNSVGQLAVSTITQGELLTWGASSAGRTTPSPRD